VSAPIAELDEKARGSYCINMVAVLPDCRGGLLAQAVSDARQQRFAEASLVVFEQNSCAVSLYRRLGFEIVASSPAIPSARPICRWCKGQESQGWTPPQERSR
jgi:ribosomal protein S18 acetylase RimI-like enzyme